MKTVFRKHLLGITAVLMLTGILAMTAFAETYTATTMRLLHYEGTVEIEDASGQTRAVVQNARFNSGESLHTGSASNASVGLDASKIVTLDENTRVQFNKQSSAMQISVTDGSILLDVKEKLQQNESLDIQTSTMAVGIQGTVVIASDTDLPAFRSKMNVEMASPGQGQGDGQSLSKLKEALQNIPSNAAGGRVSTIAILEGSVVIDYTDRSGSRQTISVNAGEKATLFDVDEDGMADQEPVKVELTSDDIFDSAAKAINSDSSLKDRIEEAGTTVPGSSSNVPGNQNDPKGSWTIDTPVTVVAQSASKMFDGDPLTRHSDVLISGIPEGYTATASANGSQTDAGKGNNPVSSFAIYDGKGNDVTSHFTRITKIPGQLIVDPAPLTVTIGSAEKVYDGTPLTCAETQLTFSSGYETRTVSQRNLSYVITEKAAAASSDSQTLYGICGTVLVHGSNPITGEVKEFALKAGERLTVYLSDKITENGTSIEYKVEKMTVADIPVEILRLYKDNPDLMSQACTDAEWPPEDLQKRIDDLNLQESEKEHRDENGLYVDSITPENLMKDSTNVHITIDSDITDYSDRALGKEEAHYTPMKVDASIRVVTSGTITDVGSVANAYTIDWGSAKENNYKLTVNPGTLTVTPAPATVTTGSAKKEYDGTPLTSSEASISGLVNGETATVTATGTITDAGTAKNTCDIDWGTAKKDNYVVESSLGTLEVTKNSTPVAIKISFAGKTYDGTPLVIDHVTVEGSSSEDEGSSDDVTTQAAAQGSSSASADTVKTAAAQSDPTGTVTVEGLPKGFTFTAKVSGSRTDAGTGELSIDSYQILDPDGKNVTKDFSKVEITGCTVTIDPAPATVTTGSASKAYDGRPLTSDTASISGLTDKDAEAVTVTANGSITNVGTANNTYTINWGEAKSSNYTLTEEIGTLEVTANDTAITFTAASDSKTYDGTPLTAGDATVEGLLENFTFTAQTEGSRTDAGSSKNTVSSYKILNADGEDVTANFTNISTVDGTLTVDPKGATVTTGSASKSYDGTALTKDEASISGLTEADASAVTVAANGSITDVGTTKNTYDIDWGTAKSSNYSLTEELGTLEVTKNSTAIIFTATSSSKTYDGSPLTAGDATAEGLLEGFTFTAETEGSQTDVGSSNNTVSSYKILNADEEDVTANFSNISTVDGTLTVNPKSATVTTGSASKSYDGTALTKDEASISGLTDADASSVTVTATGSITDIGTTGNTYSIDWGSAKSTNYTLTEEAGTLEVTTNSNAVTFTAPTASKTYDGTPLTAGDAAVEGLPENLTFTAETGGSRTDAGSIKSTVTSYKILNADEEDVTANFTSISTADGTLTVNPAPATVTTGSASKTYDGTALTKDEASITGLTDSDKSSVTVTANGSITNAGTADNTYSINWGSAKSTNYTLTETLGELKVTKLKVHFELNTYEAVYNGQKIFPDGINGTYGDGSEVESVSQEFELDESENPKLLTCIFNLKGGKIQLDCNGFTDADTYDATPADKFLSGNKDNYDISYSKIGLTIKPLQLVISFGNPTEDYIGSPLDEMPSVKYGNGEYEGDTLEAYWGSAVVGSYKLDFAPVTGEVLHVEGSGSYQDVGTYTLSCDASITTGKEANYSISVIENTLTINPAEATVTTGSAQKVYDGTPLTKDEASITGLLGLDKEYVTISATGSLKNAGTAKNTYSIDWGVANKNNYTLKENLGTLTVTKNNTEITFTTPSASKTYDGTRLGASTVTVTGLPSGFTYSASAGGNVSYTNAGEYTNTLTPMTLHIVNEDGSEEEGWCYYKIFDPDHEEATDNFSNIKESLGTLTINKATATVTTGSIEDYLTIPESEYGESALTCDEASITGLADCDKDLVTVRATGRNKEPGTTVTNTYEIDWGNANENNYNIVENLGTIKLIDIALYDPHYLSGEEPEGGAISEPAAGGAAPADDNNKQTSDTGSDTGNTNDSEKTGSDDGKSDKDTDKADRDTGETGKDNGKTDKDTGETDKNNGKAEKDTGETGKDNGKADNTGSSADTGSTAEKAAKADDTTEKKAPDQSSEQSGSSDASTGKSDASDGSTEKSGETDSGKSDASKEKSDESGTSVKKSEGSDASAEKSEKTSEKSERSSEKKEDADKADTSSKEKSADKGSSTDSASEKKDAQKDKSENDSDRKETGTNETGKSEKSEKSEQSDKSGTKESEESEKKESDGSRKKDFIQTEAQNGSVKEEKKDSDDKSSDTSSGKDSSKSKDDEKDTDKNAIETTSETGEKKD